MQRVHDPELWARIREEHDHEEGGRSVDSRTYDRQ
jgi:hypothetical protein